MAMSVVEKQQRWRSNTDNQKKEISRNAQRRHNNPARFMWQRAKERSKATGIPFDISVDDVVVPSVCPVFGFSLEHHTGKAEENSPALDRVIPALGYIKGNVRVISHKANVIKNNATPDELFLVAQYAQAAVSGMHAI